MRRRFVRVVTALGVAALCAIFACLGLATAPSASAIDNGSIGIKPSNEANFFHLSVAPGGTVAAIAVVTNSLAAPVTLSTYIVDASTATDGSFGLNSETSTPRSVGSWSHVGERTITVPAKSSQNVPFVIAVPVGTVSGDYAGGLVIQTAPQVGATTDSSKAAVRIDVVQRLGVRIYLNVPGTTRVGLTAEPLKWSQVDNKVTLSIVVHNSGNATLFPTATVKVARLFGSTTKILVPQPESVPPGATVTMSAHYQANELAEYSTASSVVVSAAGHDASSADIVIISWRVLAGVAVFVVIVGVLIWRITRFVRRARRALAHVADARTKPAKHVAAVDDIS